MPRALSNFAAMRYWVIATFAAAVGPNPPRPGREPMSTQPNRIVSRVRAPARPVALFAGGYRSDNSLTEIKEYGCYIGGRGPVRNPGPARPKP